MIDEKELRRLAFCYFDECKDNHYSLSDDCVIVKLPVVESQSPFLFHMLMAIILFSLYAKIKLSLSTLKTTASMNLADGISFGSLCENDFLVT